MQNYLFFFNINVTPFYFSNVDNYKILNFRIQTFPNSYLLHNSRLRVKLTTPKPLRFCAINIGQVFACSNDVCFTFGELIINTVIKPPMTYRAYNLISYDSY